MRKYALCVHPLYNQTCERMEIHRDEFMMRFCSCWIRLVNYIREITQTCCCIISMLTHAFPVSAGFPSGVSLAFPNFYSYGPQKLQECSSRLALNVSRRPRLPLNPSRRPWRPSSMSFGHLPGAFLKIFFWFQKATLGSRLALNVSRRPRLPLNPSRRPWQPSSMSFGHLPGAFLEIFFGFRKRRQALGWP